jgi:hypothetical protein
VPRLCRGWQGGQIELRRSGDGRPALTAHRKQPPQR